MPSINGPQRRGGGLFLIALALLAGALLAYTQDATRLRIADNVAADRLRALQAVLPAGQYDNEPHLDVIEVLRPDLLGGSEPLPIYRARLGETPVAVVMTVIAPDGFAADIRILVGIGVDGHMIGARVVEHAETPGLGDAIEASKSDWIFSFTGRDTINPLASTWVLRRDGGTFDHLTGATVTSRAVVNAVRNAVIYYNANAQALFANTAEAKLTATTAYQLPDRHH